MPRSSLQLSSGALLVAASIIATVTVGKVGAASVSAPSPPPSKRAGARPSPSASATPKPSKAPADQYFGQLKMSILGLRHQIDALGKRYDERTISDDDLLHDARFIEDGIERWRLAYPRDPWLPLTSFHLAQLDAEVQTDAARARAKFLFAYTAKYFPTSKQAHLSRERLAQGFPPFHPESPLVPAPTAAPRATPASEPSPSESPAPSITSSPSAQPSSTVPPR